MTDIGAIRQFVGGTITAATLILPEEGPGDKWVKTAGLHLEVTLADGSKRELDVYTLSSTGRQVHVRVDGMFCPPEELPDPEWLTRDAPRDSRGRIRWHHPHGLAIASERRNEASLPLWARELLRLLRQEMTLWRRALEHRNARLKETKRRMRLLQRLLSRNVLRDLAQGMSEGLWRGYDLKIEPLDTSEGEHRDDDAED